MGVHCGLPPGVRRRNGNDDIDSGFRQTGPHKKMTRFIAVNRFPEYGAFAGKTLTRLTG
jgi:hypothetical protein